MRFATAPVAVLTVAALLLTALGPSAVLAVGVANDDAYGASAPFVFEDKAFAVGAPGVLGNDTPGAGEALCIVGPPTTTAQGGSVSLVADGSFTYVPPANFAGADSFGYGVAGVVGGGACPGVADDTAVVSLTVTQVNDAPTVAVTGGCAGGVTVSEDAGSYDEACIALDPGPPNEGSQDVSAAIVEVASTFAFTDGPTITAAGALRFRPLPDANGEATVKVRAHDNGGTANGGADTSATIQITITVSPVSDAPTARADAFGALRDRTLNIASPGVLANDTDVDGDQLTASLVSGPVHGALTLAANGSFSYTPEAGFVGADAFSYRASDGSLSSPTRVVSLSVSAVPLPTPTPDVSLPPATAEPTSEPSTEVTAEPTLEALETDEPLPSEAPTVAPASPAPSATAATAAPRPTSGSGGPSLPVLLVGILFAVLLTFAGAYYVPRRLRTQRGEPLDSE